MSQAPDRQKFEELLNLLVEHKIISAPQASIASADAEVTGMPLDEVLLARRWVTEEKLYTLAPWLRHQPGVNTPPPLAPIVESKPASATEQTAVHEEATRAETPPQTTEDGSTSASDFDENLRKYRQLMSEILGEANL